MRHKIKRFPVFTSFGNLNLCIPWAKNAGLHLIGLVQPFRILHHERQKPPQTPMKTVHELKGLNGGAGQDLLRARIKKGTSAVHVKRILARKSTVAEKRKRLSKMNFSIKLFL
ncbi:hypothetical protein ACQ0QQ_05390 [Lysinibacillus sphaericus]